MCVTRRRKFNIPKRIRKPLKVHKTSELVLVCLSKLIWRSQTRWEKSNFRPYTSNVTEHDPVYLIETQSDRLWNSLKIQFKSSATTRLAPPPPPSSPGGYLKLISRRRRKAHINTEHYFNRRFKLSSFTGRKFLNVCV